MSDTTPINIKELQEYQQLGFHLVPIPPGKKGPTAKTWNEPESCIAPGQPLIDGHAQYGLAHAYSGTMALDIDDLNEARLWLQQQGVNLDTLLNAGVQVSSGKDNHAKLIYRMPQQIPALPSDKVIRKEGTSSRDILNFRCGTAAGKTIQDVLPPSIHPETRQPYRWVGDYHNIPVLPPALLGIWQDMLATKQASRRVPNLERETSTAEIEQALYFIDPDIDRESWVKIGMALHYADPGLYNLYDEWSAQGTKYQGPEDTAIRWRSFSEERTEVVTLGTLFHMARHSGWHGFRTDPKQIFHRISSSDFFIPVDQLMLDAAPEQWLIDKLLGRSSFSFLYGPASTFKSFIVTDMCFHIADGRDYHGLKVRKAQRVCLITTESNRRGVGRRLKAWADFHSLDDKQREALGEMMSVVVQPVNVADERFTTWLGSIIQAEKFALVAIDTLAANISDVEENSSSDMGRVMRNLKALASNDCGVLVVHHSGKNADAGLRGSSAMRGAADMVLRVDRLEDDNGPTNVVQLSTDKANKDAEEAGAMSFKMTRQIVYGISDEDGQPVHSLVPVKVATREYLGETVTEVEALQKHLKRCPRDRVLVDVLLRQWDGMDMTAREVGLSRAEFKQVFIPIYQAHQRSVNRSDKHATARRAFDEGLQELLDKYKHTIDSRYTDEGQWLKPGKLLIGMELPVAPSPEPWLA